MARKQRKFVPTYRELYVDNFSQLGDVLIGHGLRREFEPEVRARVPGLMTGITRCWTRWSTVWVVQCGGDSRNNRVVLAGRQPGTSVEITLPYLNRRYEVRTPLSETDRLLTALQADYARGTPTRALADALEGVLTAWAHHKREQHTGVPLAQIDRAIAEPLRSLLAAWLGDEE